VKNLLITFSGTDGSGKTALVTPLVAALNSAGLKALRVWGSYELVAMKPIVALGSSVFLRGKSASRDYNDYHATITTTIRRPLAGQVYRSLTLAEYYLQIQFGVRRRLLAGRTVVADRYTFDSLLNMAVNLGYDYDAYRTMHNRFAAHCPRPDLSFFIDVPEEIAFKRKDDIPSIDYLRKRRTLYQRFAREHDFIVLDGRKGIEPLRADMFQALSQALSQKGIIIPGITSPSGKTPAVGETRP